MSKIDQVGEFADHGDEELLLLGEGDERERFEPAILGIAHRFGMQPIVAYDYRKVIEIFAEDMSHEEAQEYFDFNVIGAWVGDGTPIFIEVIEDEIN